VNFPINGTVTTSWSSNFSQNPDTLEATASGVDWNNLVQPNAQVEFGYCANEVTPQVSDADIVSSDMAELTFNAIRLANSIENEITSNLNLMSSGSSGSTISWTSTNSAISSTGVVTRPSYEGEDIRVTLTATISKGEVSQNKIFELQVLAEEEDITPPVTGRDSKYSKVLPLALKFYEAQRAIGPFPTVEWRKSATTNDGDDVGVDLNGGWFDAGDHVKFNLPMSYSVGMLNWSMLSQRDAYIESNQLEYKCSFDCYYYKG